MDNTDNTDKMDKTDNTAVIDRYRAYQKKYRDKKPYMNNYSAKKCYWKAWYSDDFIKELFKIHGDEAFTILKKMKKEQKDKIQEQQKNDVSKLLLQSLKTATI